MWWKLGVWETGNETNVILTLNEVLRLLQIYFFYRHLSQLHKWRRKVILRSETFADVSTDCCSHHDWLKASDDTREPSFSIHTCFCTLPSLVLNVTSPIQCSLLYLQFQGKWFAMRFLLDTPILTEKRAIQFSTGGTGPAPQQITTEGVY